MKLRIKKKVNSFSLLQNYPNPFNHGTIISFSLKEKANVILNVYNLLGQKIKNIINQELDNGFYNLTINTKSMASGTYIYTLIADNNIESKKMVLLK
jgi:Secretion system C-terminal sorting domain